MAIKLNLLPPEYAVSGTLSSVLKTTRALGVILLAGFLIFAFGLGAFFLISTFQLRSLSSSEADLKSQISAREQSEQQIVLLKDRLKKIKTLQSLASSSKNVDLVEPLISQVAGGATLTEFSADSQKVDLSINFKTNSDLTNFLDLLGQSKTFKSIIMTTFGFNPLSGYLVSIRLL